MSILKRLGLRRSASGTAPSRRTAVPSIATLDNFVWLMGRPFCAAAAPDLINSVASPTIDDEALVRRVMASYQSAFSEYRPPEPVGFWDRELREVKREIHEALLGGDIAQATRLLRNPAETTHFWGFDAIAKAPPGAVEPHEMVLTTVNPKIEWRKLYSLWLFDTLVSLAEALGTRRIPYPETIRSQIGAHEADCTAVDEIFDRIERRLGVQLTFPNPFPGELGLKTKRGVAGFRSIQAIYQAWRIAQLADGRSDFKVLEIGGGLGRTAYFAALFGVKNYSIVDIPLTSAAQGYFLGRVLGDSSVRLHGEHAGGPVRILATSEFGKTDEKFDLIVNVDSWTELPVHAAEAYWKYARRNTKAFLSINHEHNAHTFQAMYSADPGVKATRFPYWMRRGYVEEFATW